MVTFFGGSLNYACTVWPRMTNGTVRQVGEAWF